VGVCLIVGKPFNEESRFQYLGSPLIVRQTSFRARARQKNKGLIDEWQNFVAKLFKFIIATINDVSRRESKFVSAEIT
jgi:hypothetical protein